MRLMTLWISNKKLALSISIFLLSLLYFYCNYSFYLPINISFSGEASPGAQFDIYFDSGDGYTSYEKVPYKPLNTLKLSEADKIEQPFSQSLLLPAQQKKLAILDS